MKSPFTIAIDHPCNQNREEMTPEHRGRFCPACQQHVVDFTTFSDAEFIAYFQYYPKRTDLCGTLSERQMKIKIPPKPAPITFWTVNKFAAASLIAALGFTYRADAQIKDTIYTSGIFERKPDSMLFEKFIVITGIVKEENGIALSGAGLSITGTALSTVSDIQGRFMLELPEQDSAYVLNCTCNDMVQQDIIIKSPTCMEIIMEYKESKLIAYTGQVIPRKTTTYTMVTPGYRYAVFRPRQSFWMRVTKPFRRRK